MSQRRSEPLVVVGAAIVSDGLLLAARRTEPERLAGGWELPGGKVEPGESDEHALVREIREELGVAVLVGERVGGDWPLGPYVLRVWLAALEDGAEPVPLEQHDALRWVDPADLDAVAWLPGDREPAQMAAAMIVSGRTAASSADRRAPLDRYPGDTAPHRIEPDGHAHP